MSLSEVFRPSNGELLTRPGPVHEGFQGTMDSYRKSRPSTQAGYRFGQLSHNSFFTRHNPHPGRVRHIKGLLDIPICAVNDDGYFANPRYSLQFPPDAHTGSKLEGWKGRIPVNAINVNSQLHPINTVTGMQYFKGLQNYPWRERAVPNVGLVPVTETWRDELRNLTEQLGLLPPQQPEAPIVEERKLPERPRTVYSAETGRIIPPPSRAMSRRASRQGSRHGQRGPQPLMHIAAEPDMESTVMTMLCQILQTEDINAVQAWLCSAGEREKGLVMDLIKSAITNKDEYYRHDFQTEFVEPESNQTKLPPINDRPQSRGNLDKQVDRLLLDDSNPEKPSGTIEHWKEAPQWKEAPKTPPKPVENDNMDCKPPDTEAFKKAIQQPDRPPTQSRLKTPIRVPSAKELARPETSSGEAKLRYTKSAHGERPTMPQVTKNTDCPKTEQTQPRIGQNTNIKEWSQQISLSPNTF